MLVAQVRRAAGGAASQPERAADDRELPQLPQLPQLTIVRVELTMVRR